MRDKINSIFSGRQGMDEFSKALFWTGLGSLLLSGLLSCLLHGVFSMIFTWLGLTALIFSFVRAFSRNLMKREAENYAYISVTQKYRQDRKHARAAAKERHAQRKDYCFFKCPGCGVMLRVPRGKGKIHISCKCGYTLYRKT